MLRVIWHRALVSIPLLFVVSALVFVLQSLLPGDAALNLAGLNASAERVEALRTQMNLDRPIHVQYGLWLGDALRGDLGQSLANNEPVVKALATRLGVTLSLVSLTTLVASGIGVALGTASALGGPKMRAFFDVLSVVGLSVPNFWLALMFISFFAVTLGWFPANGYRPLSDGIGPWFMALVLPVIAMAFWGITSIAKQTRDGMIDALSRDYIRNLRANGIPEWSVIYRHALRTAALPVVTACGMVFLSALSATVVIEKIFGLPGLGSLAVTATATGDIPLIQGVALYFTLIVIAMNLLLDIVYGWLNPKVRNA